MLAIQCAACGQSVSVDMGLGDNQPCPQCNQPVGKLPVSGAMASTALNDLEAGEKPVVFGEYGEAAVAAWDDPTEPAEQDQVAHLVADEALIDNAIINDMPPEVRAKYEARRREARRKLIGMGVTALIILVALVAFIMY